jgi:hypothetical protein
MQAVIRALTLGGQRSLVPSDSNAGLEALLRPKSRETVLALRRHFRGVAELRLYLANCKRLRRRSLNPCGSSRNLSCLRS